MTEPLFRSVHQACLFAFNFSATARPMAAAAERELLKSAKERYLSPSRGESRGLHGQDGAAQAGMIKSRLASELDADSYVVLVAMYAVARPQERLAAMKMLSEIACRDSKNKNAASQASLFADLTQRHFAYRARDRGTLAEIEQRYQLSRMTVIRRWNDVRSRLRAMEDIALSKADQALRRTNSLV